MSNKLDIHSQYEGVRGLSPVVVSDDTPAVSEIFDTQGYDGVEAYVLTGTLADAAATFTPALFHGDDASMSDEGSAIDPVANPDLVYGAPAALSQASDNVVQQFGYRGNKRYLRVKITPSGNAGSAPLAILFVGRKKKVGSI